MTPNDSSSTSPPSSPKTMDQLWNEITLTQIGDNSSSTTTPPPPPPPPETVLSLNWNLNIHFPTSNSSVPSLFGMKRKKMTPQEERRHKRTIKNRESAARSRARRQAYVTGLLLKIAHLTQENAMLREMYNKLIKKNKQALLQALPKNRGLQRSNSAPF